MADAKPFASASHAAVMQQSALSFAGCATLLLCGLAGFLSAQLPENPWLGVASWFVVCAAGLHGARAYRLHFLVAVLLVFILSQQTSAHTWLHQALVREEAFGTALGTVVFMLVVLMSSALPLAALFVGFAAARHARPMVTPVAIALLYPLSLQVTAELLGFSAQSPAHSQLDSPLSAVLPLAGEAGLVALLLFSCATLALAARRLLLEHQMLAGSWLLAVSPWLAGALLGASGVSYTQERSRDVSVTLLQPALPLREKLTMSQSADGFRSLAAALAGARGEVVIAPESALLMPWSAAPPDWREHLLNAVQATGRAFFVGTLDSLSPGTVSNLSLALRPQQATQIYVKQRLVPLGERSPRGFGWLTELLALPYEHRAVAQGGDDVFQVAGVYWRTSICLELGFGGDFAATASVAQVVVNQSNLEWFPGEAIRDLFLLQARTRALEQQKPLLLAANDGPTAMVSSDGRVGSRLTTSGAGTLETIVSPRTGATPYARMGEAAWIVPVTITLLLLLATGRPGGRRTTKPPGVGSSAPADAISAAPQGNGRVPGIPPDAARLGH